MTLLRLARLLIAIGPLAGPAAGPAAGQEADPNAPYPPQVVEFDAASGLIKEALPFGVGFLLRVPVPDSVAAIELVMGRMVGSGGSAMLADSQQVWARVPTGVLKGEAIAFRVDPLRPRGDYAFELTYHRTSLSPGVPPLTGPAIRRLTGRTEAALTAHLLTDLGVLVTSRGHVGGLTSLGIYPVPINRKEKLSWKDPSDFAKRIGFFVGLTPFELHSPVEVEALYKAGSPVLGSSLRITRSTRVGIGVLFFEQTDANPLVDRKVGKRDIFFSLTWDLRYRDVLGPIGAILALK
jgi:hypothetical protein